MVNRNELLLVDSPVDTQIYIKIDDFDKIQLDLVQVLQLQSSESRKPIYGYKNLHYHTVLAGKRIVSGTIIIKKHCFDSITSTIRTMQFKNLDELVEDKVRSKIQTIYELLDDKIETVDEAFNPSLNQTQYTKEYLLQQKNKFGADIVFSEINTRSASLKQSSVDDLNDLFDLAEKYKVTLIIKTGEKEFIIENVNFINKDTEININSSDIDDAYQFIGNLKGV